MVKTVGGGWLPTWHLLDGRWDVCSSADRVWGQTVMAEPGRGCLVLGIQPSPLGICDRPSPRGFPAPACPGSTESPGSPGSPESSGSTGSPVSPGSPGGPGSPGSPGSQSLGHGFPARPEWPLAPRVATQTLSQHQVRPNLYEPECEMEAQAPACRSQPRGLAGSTPGGSLCTGGAHTGPSWLPPPHLKRHTVSGALPASVLRTQLPYVPWGVKDGALHLAAAPRDSQR